MNKNDFHFYPRRLRCAGMRMTQTITLALMVALAIPAIAAESRAIKSRVAPIYPELAKRMRIGGVVRLEVTVDADGRVTSVKAISGNSMLVTAAQEAVRKWKFESGSGVSTVDVSLSFAL